MKKLLTSIILLNVTAINAAMYNLEIPDQHAETVILSVAKNRGWREKIQAIENGVPLYQENGNQLLIENPVSPAFITREAVIEFLLQETKTFQLRQAQIEQEKAIQAAINSINIQ